MREPVGEGSLAPIHMKFFFTWVSHHFAFLHSCACLYQTQSEEKPSILKFPFFNKQPDFIFLIFRLANSKTMQKNGTLKSETVVENFFFFLFFFLITDCFYGTLSFSKNASFMWKEVAASLLELF